MAVNFAETSLTRIIAGTGRSSSYARDSHAFRNLFSIVIMLNYKCDFRYLNFFDAINTGE